MMMKKSLLHLTMTLALTNMSTTQAEQLKIATFNVSMEALNYQPQGNRDMSTVTNKALQIALDNNHQQIRNIAEIIQRVNPDIILLNEFDNQENNDNNQHQSLKKFMTHYLNTIHGHLRDFSMHATDPMLQTLGPTQPTAAVTHYQLLHPTLN